MRTLLALVACCLVACESAQEVVDKLTPAAQKRLAVYDAAYRAALDKPVTATPVLTEKLILPSGKKPANADIIHPEWLSIPVVHSDDEVMSETPSNFVEVRNLSHGSFAVSDGAPHVYKQMFRDFMSIRYLVILSGSLSGGVIEAESYSGGGFTGSMTIIDIEKQTSLGTISISSDTAEKVQVTTGPNVKSSITDQLEYAASRRAHTEVEKALAPFLAPESGPIP